MRMSQPGRPTTMRFIAVTDEGPCALMVFGRLQCNYPLALRARVSQSMRKDGPLVSFSHIIGARRLVSLFGGTQRIECVECVDRLIVMVIVLLCFTGSNGSEPQMLIIHD
jgi:hypothetical protein